MNVNEIKEYIISSYPQWKIRTLFKHGVNQLIDDIGYDNIEQKIEDYEKYFDLDIEKKILMTMLKEVDRFDVKKNSNEYEKIKVFIMKYLSKCIPSFDSKLSIKTNNKIFDMKWYNKN